MDSIILYYNQLKIKVRYIKNLKLQIKKVRKIV